MIVPIRELDRLQTRIGIMPLFNPGVTLLLWALACSSTTCPEGQVRSGDECVDYQEGEPEPSDAWSPTPGTSWQWQLTGTIDISLPVDMYDIDLFDTDQSVIDRLHDEGKTVICYFSAGSFEDWREDAADFPQSTLGSPLDDWEGEWWVDITSDTIREIMASRLDMAVSRSCDGVEPDNVDAWANDNGLGINATEQLDFNRFLADQAHSRGLSVGLKNDLDQLVDLADWFDWALNESCVEYDECDILSVFTDQQKAAFHVEYVDDWADAPSLAEQVCGLGPTLDTLIKTWDLGSEFLSCE